MTSISDEPAIRLGWGIRRYWWVLVVLPTLLAGAGAAWGATEPTPEYEAHALVVATTVTLRGAELPQLVEAVFEAGTVAETVVARADLPYEPQRVIPTHAAAEPLADGLATRVTGRASDPATAASIANVAADALVAELADMGPSIATFQVHDLARPPTEPSNSRPGPVTQAALGGLLGMVLALALISSVLAVRRPLTHPQQVPPLLGVPLVGTARLPHRKKGADAYGPPSADVVALAKRLAPQGRGALLLTAVPGAQSVRTELAALLGPHVAHGPADVTILDDPADASDLEVPSYLVVLEGTPRATAELATIDQVPGDPVGAIWVRRGRARGARRSALPPNRPPAPGASEHGDRSDEGEHGASRPRPAGQHGSR